MTGVWKLERITQRRNRIAHQGDGQGHSSAGISQVEVEREPAVLESIVLPSTPSVSDGRLRSVTGAE